MRPNFVTQKQPGAWPVGIRQQWVRPLSQDQENTRSCVGLERREDTSLLSITKPLYTVDTLRKDASFK
jgi:hypothetical protein